MRNFADLDRVSRFRRLKDQITRGIVGLGGALVFAALLLIFLYLLYVILPVLKPASSSHFSSFSIQQPQQTLLWKLDEFSQTARRFLQDGTVEVFGFNAAKSQTEITLQQAYTLYPGNELIAQLKPVAGDGRYLVMATETGKLAFFDASVQSLSGEDDSDAVIGPFIVNAENTPVDILQLSGAYSRGMGVAITQTADGRWFMVQFETERELFSGRSSWRTHISELELTYEHVVEVLISADQRQAYVVSAQSVDVFSIQQGQLLHAHQIQLNQPLITRAQLIDGSHSLLLGLADGRLRLWNLVQTGQGLDYREVRQFDREHALPHLWSEHGRQGFMVQDSSGTVSVFYATRGSQILEQAVNQGVAEQVALSHNNRVLLLQTANEVQLLAIENEYPEINWASLWQAVWYQGYAQPEYVWQSSASGSHNEPKISLTPLVFGTIKAALYALVVAIPLAVAGAIYTAFFMSEPMRNVVKPTIEIMEALPTVIIGFLAGVWFAPYVDEHLVGMLLLLLFMPINILLCGLGVQYLPRSLRQQLPHWRLVILLFPVLIMSIWMALTISPILEFYLFRGDVRIWLLETFGLAYQQRNALVVGIAMGFAVIPTIFSIAEDAIYAVPRHLTQGSMALGATAWQTLSRVVLLTASPGIFSAIMMGLGRAVGETMIVLMVTGNTPIMDWNIFEGMRTLSANIAVEMPESDVGSSHYRVLFLSAFVLFVMTFCLNSLSEFVRQRLRAQYRSI